MLLFLKKKTEEPATPVGPVKAPRAPLWDFLPYYCHYNPHTLLTKNGEVMQIIRIARNNRGLNYESGDGDIRQGTIRENIRAAITAAAGIEKYSLWIHTLRKRTLVSHGAQYAEPLASYVHEKWQKKSKWKFQYYNEVYITVIHDGQSSELLDKKHIKDAVIPKTNRRMRNGYLDQAATELHETVEGMLQKIRQHYQAERLALAERAPAPGQERFGTRFYSEPMEFLGTLLNLRPDTFPLPEADISTALCTHDLTFGYNAVEAKDSAGNKRFAALLTLKQYREATPETIDRILQSPIEMIISQAFHFIPHQNALKEYRDQREVFEMSGDRYSVKATGLEEMLLANREAPSDFGSHQTSIMMAVDDYKQLDIEVAKAHEAFGDLGLITIREDVKFEECFWSQMPGNFPFIRRKDSISTSRIGGFCRLNLFPNGTSTGNHWGDAVILMPTTVNSPYFFNFHDQDNGHTVLFDFNSFHDRAAHILLNFLLTASLKFQPKIFIFDRQRSSQLFYDKLGGDYHRMPFRSDRHATKRTQMNPFALEDTPHNRSFLLAWCVALAEGSIAIDEERKTLLKTSLDQLFAGTPQRNLEEYIGIVAAGDVKLARVFAEFRGYGKFSGWFDGELDSFDLTKPLHAFDMDPAVANPSCTIPLFSYIMHRIIGSLDGQPTIIVLQDAWDLLENPFFAPRLESLMEMLKQQNVMVICTTGKPSEVRDTQTFATLSAACASQIIVPDDINLNYVAQGIGLNEHGARLLSKMDRQKGDFLLLQSRENIGLSINLDEMEDAKTIFAGDVKNLIAAGGPFASLPEDY